MTIDEFMALLPKNGWFLTGPCRILRRDPGGDCPLEVAAGRMGFIRAAEALGIPPELRQRIVNAADGCPAPVVRGARTLRRRLLAELKPTS